MEAPLTLFRVYLGMVTCFRARLCWGGGNVTFFGIYSFPLYCWCQCGLLGHYRYGMMQVAMVFSCVIGGGCWRRPLEHAPLIAQSVQEFQCDRM